MPPRAKFTSEQITQAALSIVREKGFEKLTARALSERLGSSACPIFTVFANMEQVQQSTLEAARALYRSYVEKGLSETPAFKGVGMQYIRFAINEPKLFQALFMRERSCVPNLDSVLPLLDESYDKILSSITTQYALAEHAAEKLYRHLWIYTHGIAALCATKTCGFAPEQIGAMMSEVFSGLIKTIKEGTSDD